MTLAGKYMLDKADNYGEWLAAIGVTHDDSVGTTQFRPTITITHEGDEVEMSSYIGNGYANNVLKFTLGKTCSWNCHGKTEKTYHVKFVQVAKNHYKGTYDYNGFKGESEFEVLDDKLVQTYTQGNVKSRKEYTRV